VASQQDEQSRTRPGSQSFDYFGILFRHKRLCLLAPIALTAVACLVSFLLPKWYLGEAVVVISGMRRGQNEIETTLLSTREVARIFQNGSVISQVIKDFQLDADYGLDREMFERRLLSVDVPRVGNTVSVEVKMPTPQLAREVTNKLVTSARDEFLQQLRARYTELLENLQNESSSTRKKLEEAEDELQEFEAEAKIETLRRRVSVQQKLLASQDRQRAELEISLSGVRDRIKTYEELFAKEKEFIELDRILAKNPLMQQALARETGRKPEDLMHLKLKETIINASYMQIKSALISGRAEEKEIVAKLSAIDKASEAGETLLAKLQEELAHQESQLRRRNFERDRAAASASMAIHDLEELKLVPAWPLQHLVIIPASMPVKPHSPRPIRNSAAALAVSLLLTWGVAVLLDKRAARAAQTIPREPST